MFDLLLFSDWNKIEERTRDMALSEGLDGIYPHGKKLLCIAQE